MSSNHDYKPRLTSTVRAARVGQRLVLEKGDWVAIDTEGRLHRFSPGQFQAMFEPVPLALPAPEAVPAPAKPRKGKKPHRGNIGIAHRPPPTDPGRSKAMREQRAASFWKSDNARMLLLLAGAGRPLTVPDIKKEWPSAGVKTINGRLYQLVLHRYVAKHPPKAGERYFRWSITALGQQRAAEVRDQMREGAKAA